MTTSVLIIDDDKFIHKVIKKTIEPQGFTANSAFNGTEGIAKALEVKPDIILLDVEMPGVNGYEVCEQLKSLSEAKDVAIVFLSSQSTLRERLQGYEVGADDYLTKPFEKEHLVARLKVLGKYQEERQEMQERFKLAEKTALTALTGTSEISLVMHFMEKSFNYNSVEEVINGLLETTEKFSIQCCVHVNDGSQTGLWFSSGGAVSPLEKELVLMSDQNMRFLDFGSRTVVHYSPTGMLVKNMPIEDMDRYGRLKDLLPVLLSIVVTKLNSIQTYLALIEQSKDLRMSFSDIRKNLYALASTIVDNRGKSTELANETIQQLGMKLMSMGLDDDQETYLIELIDHSFSKALQAVDVGAQLRNSFTFILKNLEATMEKHDLLLDEFILSQNNNETDDDDQLDDDVELF